MHQRNKQPQRFLQLFAEGAEGASGVTAPDAGVQGVKQNKTDATARTSENTPDRNARFDQLIKGEFKDLYDARVQDIVQKRLKSQSKTLEQYQTLEPTLDLLVQRYGVEPGDWEALHQAIASDRRAAPLTREQVQQKAQQQYDRWIRQAEQAKRVYPGLDLRKEVHNPRFMELLGRGLPVEEAFLLSHRHEIIPAAMRHSAKAAERKLANWIVANGTRPPESGMSAQGTVVKNDVSTMSRAQRQDLIRRVRQGERIRL